MNNGSVVVEQKGSHFVAWLRAADGRARRALIMVGRTAEEAEARLAAWWAAHPDE